MSNLDTLLEAAKFVEGTDTNEDSARAPDPPEFHGYAKSPTGLMRSNSGSDKSDANDDGKDRKKHGGAGTREVHNKLEKNRRAHLKECFDSLKVQIPTLESHNKVSNLSILRGAFRYIQTLKRREGELDQEMRLLGQVKSITQEKIAGLKNELNSLNIEVDVSNFMPHQDEDTRSVSTATADNGSPIMSEDEDMGIIMEDKPVIVQPVNRSLSFSNVLKSNNVGSVPNIATTTSAVTTKTSMHPPPPLFTVPRRVIGPPPRTNHTPSTIGANNKTIAAMLTSVQSRAVPLKTEGARKSASAPNMVTSQIVSNVVPTSHQSAASLIQTLVSASNQAMASSAVTSTAITNSEQKISAKIPVNQLLQQTIAQRVQMQQLKLQQQQQQPAGVAMSPTSGGPPNRSLTVKQLTATVPQVIAMNANALRPMVSTLKTVPQLRPAVALNHVLPSGFTFNATPSLLASSISGSPSSSTASSVPFVLSKLAAIPTTTTSTMTLSTASTSSLLSQLNALATSTSQGSSLTGVQTLNLATMKPMITLPITPIAGAQLVSQQVTTLQELMSQAVAKSSALLTTTTSGSANASASLLSPPVTQVSAMAAAGLTQLAGTQFVPISVVSPAQMQGGTLNQANLTNAALSTQMLKTLGQLPILQQPFTLPIKPVVMVTTLPSVVTTTAVAMTPNAPTIQVNLPVSQS